MPKPKMVAIVTVIRKFLHAIHGLPRRGQDFHREKFNATPQTAPVTSCHLTGYIG
jgi:hypothetical protein